MSYRPVFHAPSTPPHDTHGSGFHSRNVSSASTYSLDSSPEDFQGTLPTPVITPVRQIGPLLLPKIRSQDQCLEQVAPPVPPIRRHRKALSCTHNPPGTKPISSIQRPETVRRSASPGGVCDPISSLNRRSTNASSHVLSTLSSPISLRSSSSSSSSTGHSRRASASNVDDLVLNKYGFPTYRQMPGYPSSTASAIPTSSIASAFISSTTVPSTSTFTAPDILPTRRSHVLPSDLQFSLHSDTEPSTITMLDYLTGPNPAPHLVRQLNIHAGKGPGQRYFWWDIRNLRTWSDFAMPTIASFPGLLPLLRCALPSTALPSVAIARPRLQPDTEVALHALYQSFYAEKVNRALRVAQGQTHMVMRTLEKSSPPLFVSCYQDDSTGMLGPPRVVGLVKSFDRWNTGMRAEAPHRKVEYLLGLAHLHHHMRDTGCRYGFILTEIELVVVRAGVEPIPQFGSLDVAVINLARQRQHQANAERDENENLTHDADAADDDEDVVNGELSAAMALWYLHMLAKEVPLPGQPGARIDVGGPAACTRHKCEDQKDKWIPEPQLGEKRQAKRERGWVFPRDPLHRKELPRRSGK